MLYRLIGLLLVSVLAFPNQGATDYLAQNLTDSLAQDAMEFEDEEVLEDYEWDALLEDLTDFEEQEVETPLSDSTDFTSELPTQEVLEPEEQTGTIEVYQDPNLSMLLDKERAYAPLLRKPKRKSIQIESSNNLQKVKDQCEKSTQLLGKPCQIKYESPNYKCWCGQYKSELDAERAWELFKVEFPSALLINLK